MKITEIKEVDEAEDDWLDLVEEMFGIPKSCLEKYAVVQMNQKSVSLVPKMLVGERREKYVSAGLTLFHTRMKIPKISTAAVVAIGRYATKMVVNLNNEELDKYFRRETQIVRNESMRECYRDGYVVVTYTVEQAEIPIGVGMLRTIGEDRELESYYPKAFKPSVSAFEEHG